MNSTQPTDQPRWTIGHVEFDPAASSFRINGKDFPLKSNVLKSMNSIRDFLRSLRPDYWLAARYGENGLELAPRVVGFPTLKTALNEAESIAVSVSGCAALLRISRQNPDLGTLLSAVTLHRPVALVFNLRSFEIEQCDQIRGPLVCNSSGQWTPTPLKVNPIKADASEMFNYLKTFCYRDDNRCSDCIPFLFPFCGCEYRAHKACSLLAQQYPEEKDNIFKVYLQPADRSLTNICSENWPGGVIKAWTYHVAPAVSFQSSDGTPETIVFDPSLVNQTLTVAEWKHRIVQDADDIPDPEEIPAKSLVESDGKWMTDDTLVCTEGQLAILRSDLEALALTEKHWPPYATACPL